MSHSAGPWRHEGVEIYGADGKHVVWELGNDNSDDMNLIVAAPDMLEALNVAQSHLRHLANLGASGEFALQVVSAAIAKAGGR